MKSMFICQNLNVGGAEELILGASTALPAVGVQAEVVALGRRGPVADEIEGVCDRAVLAVALRHTGRL